MYPNQYFSLTDGARDILMRTPLGSVAKLTVRTCIVLMPMKVAKSTFAAGATNTPLCEAVDAFLLLELLLRISLLLLECNDDAFADTAEDFCFSGRLLGSISAKQYSDSRSK